MHMHTKVTSIIRLELSYGTSNEKNNMRKKNLNGGARKRRCRVVCRFRYGTETLCKQVIVVTDTEIRFRVRAYH